MKKVTLVGIDTAKLVFELVGVTEDGEVVFGRKNLRRSRLLSTLAQLEPCTVVLEACGASHHWGRCIGGLGHEVRLIAPQFVKPYRRGQKNDRRDADALVSAARAPGMRFVAVKSAEQQSVQALHRVRQRVQRERVAMANQLRGLLAEHGEVFALGEKALREGAQRVLEKGQLPRLMNELVGEQLSALERCKQELAHYDRRIERQLRTCAVASALEAELDGVGALTATATVAKVADARAYRNGREYAASLGFVPRQYSSGGRVRLGKMSKAGDRYLRTLYIHGARSVLRRLGDKQDAQSRWLRALVARRGFNIACVALAHRNARRAWAIMAGRTPHHEDKAA
jgi:transposase